MNCENCGKVNNETDNFCEFCGVRKVAMPSLSEQVRALKKNNTPDTSKIDVPPLPSPNTGTGSKGMPSESKHLDKILKISIIVASLVISISIAYYFLFFIPHKEAVKQRAEKEATVKLEKCLSEVKDSYDKRWSDTCKTSGATVEADGSCLLDDSDANYVYKRYQDSKSECYRQ